MEITIMNLSNTGDRWSWAIKDSFKLDDNGNPVVKHYYTNDNGEGIFEDAIQYNRRGEAIPSGKRQIAGTCQFSLRGASRATARRRIARVFDN